MSNKTTNLSKYSNIHIYSPSLTLDFFSLVWKQINSCCKFWKRTQCSCNNDDLPRGKVRRRSKATAQDGLWPLGRCGIWKIAITASYTEKRGSGKFSLALHVLQCKNLSRLTGLDMVSWQSASFSPTSIDISPLPAQYYRTWKAQNYISYFSS